MGLPWGRPLTYDDLQNMPDDGHRYELIDGALIVTPAPATAHQVCVVRLFTALDTAAGSDHLVLVAPYDYVISRFTTLEPDVLVMRTEDVGEKHLDKTPLLVCEVLSTSTRRIDLATKRLAYEDAGVPAYWVVDPDVPSLTALRLETGRYVEEATVAGDEVFVAMLPFQVTIVPTALLRGLPH